MLEPFLLPLAVAFVAFLGFKKSNEKKKNMKALMDNPTKIEATVIEIIDEGHVTNLTYEFEDNTGKKYTKLQTGKFDGDSVKEGTKIEVVYQPGKPLNNMLPDGVEKTYKFYGLVCNMMLAIIVLLAPAIYFILK